MSTEGPVENLEVQVRPKPLVSEGAAESSRHFEETTSELQSTKGGIFPYSRSGEGSALRIELSSGENCRVETDENENNISQKMGTQEPQPTEAELSSPRVMPMDIKEEGEKTPPQTSSGTTQETGSKQNRMVTRHKTRPLRDLRLPKFLGDRIFTSGCRRIGLRECCWFSTKYFG